MQSNPQNNSKQLSRCLRKVDYVMFEYVLDTSLAVITNSKSSKSCSAMKKALQYTEKSNVQISVQSKQIIRQKIYF